GRRADVRRRPLQGTGAEDEVRTRPVRRRECSPTDGLPGGDEVEPARRAVRPEKHEVLDRQRDQRQKTRRRAEILRLSTHRAAWAQAGIIAPRNPPGGQERPAGCRRQRGKAVASIRRIGAPPALQRAFIAAGSSPNSMTATPRYFA